MIQKIGIDPARAAQLAQVRDHLGHASLNETIRELIAAFSELHKIKIDIPGIDIRKCSDGLVVRFEGQEPEGMTSRRALAVAQAIRDYLAEPGPRKSLYVSGADEHHYLVRGHGRSVVIQIGDTERAFSPDVAAEFADHLERAA